MYAYALFVVLMIAASYNDHVLLGAPGLPPARPRLGGQLLVGLINTVDFRNFIIFFRAETLAH